MSKNATIFLESIKLFESENFSLYILVFIDEFHNHWKMFFPNILSISISTFFSNIQIKFETSTNSTFLLSNFVGNDNSIDIFVQ